MQPSFAGPAPEQVGWVLLHFLWQGALLGALFWCANFTLRRCSANARYLAGCLTLLMMAASPIVTLCALRASADGTSASLLLSGEQVEQLLATPFLGGGDGAAAGILADRSNASAGVFNWKRHVDTILPWLTIAWLIGVVLMALRQAGGWLWLSYTVRSATQPLQDDRLAELAQRLVRRPVRFLESWMVQGPATLGVLRPIILLPITATTGLTHKQLLAIMAHELAHIRRWDYVVNVAQAAIEALLFFHPAVWWVSRRVRQERENCCDDIAVDVVGDRTLYAIALERLDRLRDGHAASRAQLALGAGGGDLLIRIGRLLGVRPYDLAHVGRGAGVVWGIGCAIVLLLAVELLAASNVMRVALPPPIPTIAASVYGVLGLPRGGGDPLAAIAAAIPTAKDDEIPLRTLAENLTRGGDPDALADAIFQRVTLRSATAYQSSPDWRYGTFPRRDRLRNRMLDHARDSSLPPDDQRLYARAAIALAAQDASLFGLTTLRTILEAPRITRAAGLNDADLATVLAASKAVEEQGKVFVSQLVRVRRAMEGASPSQPTQGAVAEIDQSFRAMAALAHDRLDLQWHLANQVWRYKARAGAAADPLIADLNAELRSPQFAKWVAESTVLPPPAPRKVRTITGEELKKYRNLTKELREKLAEDARTDPK